MADLNLIYNCPGCGKPFRVPEGALTNRCDYCDLVVRLGAPRRVLKYFYPSRIDDYGARMAADRYLKGQGLPLTGNVLKTRFFYLPFYRFRGIALDFIKPRVMLSALKYTEASNIKTEPKMKAKDFDVTIPAFSSDEFGMASLGIRPQSVPLYGFKKDEIPADSIVVGSDITVARAEDRALKMHESNVILYNKNTADFSAVIGERISVIYFPVWTLTHEVNGEHSTVFIDALARRGYFHIGKDFDYQGKLSCEENSYYIEPVRHQCPNCGADLKEDHFSLFYPCINCKRSYILDDSEGYKQVHVKSAGTSVGAPFWRFPLTYEGQRSFKTVFEFSKLLTSEITFLKKEKRNNQFYLYSPAFKSSDVQSWFKNAYSVLLSQPHDELFDALPPRCLAFNIDECEARQMAIFLWRKLTSRYSWNLPPLMELSESDLPAGEIVWLPASNYALIKKVAGYKEVIIPE